MVLDTLKEKLRSPWPVLDVHVHPLDCFGFYNVNSPAEDARLLIASAKRAGVEKMCLFSLFTTCPREPTMDECRQANDYAMEMQQAAPDVLLTAVREVLKGFIYVPPNLASKVLNSRKLDDSKQSTTIQLQPQHREILRLLAEGLTAKEIAVNLNLSAKTIEYHKYQIMLKLNVQSSAQLISYAVKHGITSV